MKLIIKCLLLLHIATGMSIAQTLTVKGIVKDSHTEEVLPGANIYLQSNWRTGVATNPKGQFSLTYEPGSSVDTLIVSFIGYQEKQFLISDKSEVVVIMLEPASLKVDEIVIKAEKLVAEEFAFKKIKKLDIYTNPSAKADPLLAVNSLPSATTLDESANISFRGSSPASTGIFFNNVPLYDAVRFSQLNGIGTFSIFNTAIVDNMQVFPGNPPLEFGNTTSGLIAIQTTNDIPKEPVNNITVSMASYGALTSRKINEKAALTAFFNYQPSFLLKATNSQALKDIRKFNSIDAGLNFIHQISNKTALKIFNYSLDEKYGFEFTSPTYNGRFNQKKSRNLTVSNLRHKMKNSEITLNSGFGFTKANYTYSLTDISIKNHDLFTSINYQYFGEKFNFKSGFSHDQRKQMVEGNIPTYFYAVGLNHPVISISGKEKIATSEIYSYAKYYLSNKTVVGAGLRSNLPNDDVKNYLSKQLNFRHTFTSAFSFNISWGNYNKTILPQGSEAEVSLIQSSQFSIDLEYKKKASTVTLSLFKNRSKQQAQTTRTNGIEMFVKQNLTSRFNGQVSLAYIDGEVKDESINYSSPYDMNFFIKGNLQYKFKNFWTLTSTYQFREGSLFTPITSASFNNSQQAYEPMYADKNGQERYGNYKIIDLSLSKMMLISEDLTIIVFSSINNMFNFKNTRSRAYNFDYSGYDNTLFSQRSFYAGFTINF